MKWKNGDQNPRSVVITDFEPLRWPDAWLGTPGWAPPEQWIGKFLIP